MKFIDFLKKAWKFIVGIIAGIGATLLIGRLFRGKTNRTHLPINGDSMSDRLLSDITTNKFNEQGRIAERIDGNNRVAGEAIERATDHLNKSIDGISDSKERIDRAKEIIAELRKRDF